MATRSSPDRRRCHRKRRRKDDHERRLHSDRAREFRGRPGPGPGRWRPRVAARRFWYQDPKDDQKRESDRGLVDDDRGIHRPPLLLPLATARRRCEL